MKSSNPPAFKTIIDPEPVKGAATNSYIRRCLFLGYKGSQGFPINSFPTILYFGEDYARGQEIAEESGRNGFNFVQGFRGFEASPRYRRAFEQATPVAASA